MPSLMMMPMFLGSSFVLLIVAHSLYFSPTNKSLYSYEYSTSTAVLS